MQFTYTDALILYSIYSTENTEEGSPLPEMIAFADYANHAILKLTELNDSGKKLCAADCIYQKNGKLFTNEKFKNWFLDKFAEKKRQYIMKTIERIAHYLNSLSPEEVNSTIIFKPYSEKEFENAVQQYLQRMRKKS